MKQTIVGKSGLAVAVAVFLAMAAAAFLIVPGSGLPKPTGICLPPPSEWPLAPWISWSLNAAGLLLCAAGLGALNRRFSFVAGTDTMLSAAFLVLTASCPWDVQKLTAGVLLAAANLAAFSLLFSCSENRNNTQRIFTAASLFSLGSAFHPAFLVFIPACLAAAITVKAMRAREAAAFLLGLIAPYATLLGFGIASPVDFRFEWFSPVFAAKIPSGTFIAVIGVAFTMLWTVLAGFSNTFRLLKANGETRRFNAVVSITGIAALAGCLLNFSGATAYLPTLFIVSSTQMANAFALYPGKTSGAIPFAMLVAYTALFILSSGIL